MGNQALEYKGKTHSFYTLIKEQKIEIPIIQRDYAQGRKNNNELLTDFLSALKKSLATNAPITLDFIYGSTTVNNSFQPLDGQQRLTTLFLLHWYATLKENVSDDDVKETLSRFSYENRISSREFCRSLISNTSKITFTKDDSENLSKKIIDSHWFFLSWKKDPTITAMLNAIDCINCLFSGTSSLWKRLTSKKLISFNYVELKQIGLTDDLYIRMNARGKLLTPFEKFKAELEKHLEKEGWENNLDYKEKFATKIDTTWANFFWKYYKIDKSIDLPLMRFISTVQMIKIALEAPSSDDRNSKISKLHENPNKINPLLFTKNYYAYLRTCFDIYCNLEEPIKEIAIPPDFPFWNHKPKESELYENGDFIKSIAGSASYQKGSASYAKKVLFFAQTEYLRKTSRFDRDKFLEWMRVVRNIVSRGDIYEKETWERYNTIRSPQTFAGAIKLVYELAEGCENIYTFLSSSKDLKSKFSKKQIAEEREKARLISEKASLKKDIWKAENTNLLRGKISFIFDCIGYKYGAGAKSIDEEKLSKIQAVFYKHFNKDEQEITPETMGSLRRAFFTIEVASNYCFYNYWNGHSPKGKNTKWKLFPEYRELEYYLYCTQTQRKYFEKLVLKLVRKLNPKLSANDELKSIVDDFKQKLKGKEFNRKMPNWSMPKWKQKLITDPELLDNYKYIVITDSVNYCYLLKKVKQREKNYEEISGLKD